MNPLFEDIYPVKASAGPTSFVSNPETNTIEWVLDAKMRPVVSDTLTTDDRQQLAKTGLNNLVYFSRAKVVYAAGGGAAEIQKACGKSLSYAEKVHAAFERAAKCCNRKNPLR